MANRHRVVDNLKKELDMKKMLLAGGCIFFLMLCVISQGFAQQDAPSTKESQVFTENDQLNLERAIEQENWETAIFYCEKRRRRFRAEANALEAKIKNLAELLIQLNDPDITARVNTQLKELDVVLKKTAELTRKDDKMLQDLKRIAMEKKSLSGKKA